MNCFGRTPSNKSRLRLKGFHNRQIFVRIVESLIDYNVKLPPINNLGASSSGGRENIKSSFTYTLEKIKKYDIIYHNFYRKRIQQTFNKPQLIGKVLLIENRRYRIISKY